MLQDSDSHSKCIHRKVPGSPLTIFPLDVPGQSLVESLQSLASILLFWVSFSLADCSIGHASTNTFGIGTTLAFVANMTTPLGCRTSENQMVESRPLCWGGGARETVHVFFCDTSYRLPGPSPVPRQLLVLATSATHMIPLDGHHMRYLSSCPVSKVSCTSVGSSHVLQLKTSVKEYFEPQVQRIPSRGNFDISTILLANTDTPQIYVYDVYIVYIYND